MRKITFSALALSIMVGLFLVELSTQGFRGGGGAARGGGGGASRSGGGAARPSAPNQGASRPAPNRPAPNRPAPSRPAPNRPNVSRPSVKETQRVAMRFGESEDIVVETGLYNLTQAETPVLVHLGPDKVENWLLVRLDDPAPDDAEDVPRTCGLVNDIRNTGKDRLLRSLRIN